MAGKVNHMASQIETLKDSNTTYYHEDHGKRWVFIPCYPRIVIKSLRGLEVAKGKVTVEYTLIMSFACKGLPKEIIATIVKEGVEYRLNEQSHTLKHGEEGTIVHHAADDMVTFTSRNNEDVRFYVELLTTPFDSFEIKIKFELTSRPLKIDAETQKGWPEQFQGI